MKISYLQSIYILRVKDLRIFKYILLGGLQLIFIHWILWIIILSYVIFKKRNIDFYTIAVLGFMIYTLPAFWGTTWTTQGLYFSEIHFETYLLVDMISLILFISMINFDRKTNTISFREIQWNHYPKYLFYLLLIFSYISIILAIYKVGLSSLLAETKNPTHIEKMNPFFSLSIWTSLICFSFGAASKNKFIGLLPLPIMIFTLFLGIRSFFVIGIISYVITLLSHYGKTALFRKWKYGLTLGFIMIIATIYREVYFIIKRGDFEYVFTLLTSKDFYQSKVFVLPHEIYIVFSTLNISLSQKLNLGLEFILYQILDFIPFMGVVFELPELKYSKVIMEEFYSESQFGMGSNIWAEMYSSGGFILVLVFALIWVGIIKILNYMYLKRMRLSVFFIPFGIYFIFYINRLSFSLAIGDLKYVVFIYILSLLIYLVCLKPYVINKIDKENV